MGDPPRGGGGGSDLGSMRTEGKPGSIGSRVEGAQDWI